MNISIQEALSLIKESDSDPFTLRFVRSSGKRRGSIKTVIAYYGTQSKTRSNGASQREVIKMKDAGTIPIIDSEAGIGQVNYLTPLISHIIQFNQYKVIH